jgi:hypothetical protein
MQFTIHFRGVAVYVARQGGKVTDVLFPSAEMHGPPNGDPGKKTPKGKHLGKEMKHADGTDAPQHFAGAMIMGPGNTRIYRKLEGRLVKRDTLGSGAAPQDKFLDSLPRLADVITNKGSKLKLLALDIPANVSRMATRFMLDGGDLFPGTASEGTWVLAGGVHGPNAKTGNFALEGKWVFDAAAPVHLRLLNLDGNPSGEDPITLDDKHSEVYFYNYDVALPTVSDLTEEDIPASLNLIDHDFKWNYELFDRVNGAAQPQWKDWLQQHDFPAPQLIGQKEPPLGLDSRLITVSTCFQLVWTGD